MPSATNVCVAAGSGNVEVWGASHASAIQPGKTVTFTLNLQNLVDDQVSYAFNTEAGSWPVDVVQVPDDVSYCDQAQFQAVVTVPRETPGLILGGATLVVSAVDRPSVQTQIDLTVETVACNLMVTPESGTLYVSPGDVVTHSIVVSNLSVSPETFSIEGSGAQWAVTFPSSTGLLPVGGSTILEFVVSIPTDPSQITDELKIVYRSTSDTLIAYMAEIRTRAADVFLHFPLVSD